MAFVLNIEPCPNCRSKMFHFDMQYDKQSEQKNEFSSFVLCKNCNYTYDFTFKFDDDSDDMMYLSDFVKQYNNEVKRLKFLPCPFCGSKSIDVEHVPDTKDEDHYTIYGYYKIYCKGCECSTPKCDTYDEALKKWNTRIRKM